MVYLCRLLLLISFLFVALSANAAVIEYSLTNIAGNSWRYDYGVTNDTNNTITEFTIFFDLHRYSNLHVVHSDQDWDSIVVQPDPGLPSDGFFDALALSAGLVPGSKLSIGAFSVLFDFTGPGAPGSQPFETYNAAFEMVGSGFTRLPSSVPEPSTGHLILAAGLAFRYMLRRRRQGGIAA